MKIKKKYHLDEWVEENKHFKPELLKILKDIWS